MSLRSQAWNVLGRSIIVVGLMSVLLLVLQQTGAPPAVRYEAIDGDTINAVRGNLSLFHIRYAAVNTPGDKQTLGETALELNRRLIQEAQEAGSLVVDLKPSDQGDNGTDRDGRLLAHAFVSDTRSPGTSVEVLLVSAGYARLDVRDPIDKDIAGGKDFDVEYADTLIAEQIQAAMDRRGWWRQDDEYKDADLVIAVVKQWSNDETVYIINRGTVTCDLTAGWTLEDERNHRLLFSEFPGCILNPRGVLRVHSGPAVSEKKGSIEEQPVLQGADLYWLGESIWNNDRDAATLRNAHSDVAYRYEYPLTTKYWK